MAIVLKGKVHKTVVPGERILFNLGNACGEGEPGKAVAVIEYSFRNVLQAAVLFKGKVAEGAATIEGIGIQLGNAGRDGNACQTFAIREGLISQIG